MRRAGPVLGDVGSGDGLVGGDCQRRNAIIQEWDAYIKEKMDEEFESLATEYSGSSLDTGVSGSCDVCPSEMSDSDSIFSESSNLEEGNLTLERWRQFAADIWSEQGEDEESIWDCFY